MNKKFFSLPSGEGRSRAPFYLLSGIGCLVLVLAILAYFFLTPLSKSKQTEYLYIDNDDTVDSVFVKLSAIGNNHALSGMKTLIRHSSYADNIRSGRFAVEPENCAITVFRRIKNGQQQPLNLTIPPVRTVDRLGAELSKKLMLDSATIVSALTDTAVCQRYGYEPATMVCMFVPNTYELYWNVSLDKFLDRMKKESDAFWKGDRQAKADQMGLAQTEVITLASIIDEETANDAEKPMIAG
ncbi:MAG: endolytic transglycosylase MltG, partial [Prevotella sp.]|nr:endolytic transglycosylase MltG [Prevotella sp.]